MATLIFDIETAPLPWESFDSFTQNILLGEGCEDLSDSAQEERKHAAISGLGLSAFTGQVITIGVYDLERKQGAVYFQSDEQDDFVGEDGFYYRPRNEKEMLEDFWSGAKNYDAFVSFAGRTFDAPFLHFRSAVHQLVSTKDLMEHRYLNRQVLTRHIDLQDQLSYYGAVGKRPSLHMSCTALGIESSKEAGVSGKHVAELFRQKKFRDIAAYNVRDVVATASLYQHWHTYLAPVTFKMVE